MPDHHEPPRPQPAPTRAPDPTPADPSRSGAQTTEIARQPIPKAILGAVLAVVVFAAGLGAFVLVGQGDGATELVLEGATDPGQDAFVPEAELVSTGNEVTATPEYVAPQPLTNDQILARSFKGSQPGLYGGTGKTDACNKAALSAFLEENPDKRAAFSEAIGIAQSHTTAYIDTLTTVQLMHDTRVTNHGYRDGRPTEYQAVLQAGTAVMIDGRGVPRVKCNCGNPLSEPKPRQTTTVVGAGGGWPSFHPQGMVTIEPARSLPATYVLTNVADGTTIERQASRPATQDELSDAPAPQIAGLSNVLADSIVKADPVTAFADLEVPDEEGSMITPYGEIDRLDDPILDTPDDVLRDTDSIDDSAPPAPGTDPPAPGGGRGGSLADLDRICLDVLGEDHARDRIREDLNAYACIEEIDQEDIDVGTAALILWSPDESYADLLDRWLDEVGPAAVSFDATVYFDGSTDDWLVGFPFGPYLAGALGESRRDAEQLSELMYEFLGEAGYR